MEHDHEPDSSSNLINRGQSAGGGSSDPTEQVGDVDEGEISPTGQIEQAGNIQDNTPRIWVGSLSDYNAGILHGEWIDAARESEEIWADIHRMLAASPTTARYGEPAEEWGIFDFDGFGLARVYQHDRLEAVARVARGIAEHGLAFAAWADVMEGDDAALDTFEDAYLGHYDSVEAYAEQLIDDLGYDRLLDEAIPEHLRSYVRIDTDALARDMQMGGDIHAITAEDGGVWLFDARQ